MNEVWIIQIADEKGDLVGCSGQYYTSEIRARQVLQGIVHETFLGNNKVAITQSDTGNGYAIHLKDSKRVMRNYYIHQLLQEDDIEF